MLYELLILITFSTFELVALFTGYSWMIQASEMRELNSYQVVISNLTNESTLIEAKDSSGMITKNESFNYSNTTTDNSTTYLVFEKDGENLVLLSTEKTINGYSGSSIEPLTCLLPVNDISKGNCTRDFQLKITKETDSLYQIQYLINNQIQRIIIVPFNRFGANNVY